MILHQDKQEFLDKCLDILVARGHFDETLVLFGEELGGIVYEDEVIYMAKALNDRHMIMIRKYNDNPFFYYYNGSVIRFESDYIFLDSHINLLKDS